MQQFIDFILRHQADITAVFWFVLCFRGYAIYAERAKQKVTCLASIMHQHRIEWMERLLDREVRVADTTAIANLERTVAFFASTSLLILAGIVTVLGASDKAIDIVADLPFVTPMSKAVWELKLLLLVMLFVYAFFKFTWSLRQYGFASVMIGATPFPANQLSDKARNAYVLRNAKLLSLAANNFNVGLRTFYFSMAVLGWFINAWLFALLTLIVVFTLYRREFKSRTLRDLSYSDADY